MNYIILSLAIWNKNYLGNADRVESEPVTDNGFMMSY